MLNSLIVGFGFAGANLHVPALLAARRQSRALNTGRKISIVDKAAMSLVPHGAEVECLDAIPHALGREPTVCHVCTPVAVRGEIIDELAAKGYRCLIVEKPLARTEAEIEQIEALVRRAGLELLVVSVFSFSAAIQRLRQELEAERIPGFRNMEFRQYKSRYSRSLARINDGEHVFDIEAPHQVSLAMDLFGDATVEDAATAPMVLPDRKIIPDMGEGLIRLRHEKGAHSVLRSSLIHRFRERRVELWSEGGGDRIICDFPVSRDDSVSTLSYSGMRLKLFDDPLMNFFVTAYEYFDEQMAGRTAIPPRTATLAFHRGVSDVLAKAKAMARSATQIEQVAANAY